MNTQYARYLKNFLGQEKQHASLLTEWSDQNSHTDNLAGLRSMLRQLKKQFSALGGRARTIPIPSRKKIHTQGHLIDMPQGSALEVVRRPKAPLQVLLGGHMDTVFPLDSPFQKAHVRADRIYGPGVADMKGGLLVMLKALEILESSPWKERLGWQVLITADEEAGSCGSAPLYRAAAQKASIGLLFEPSFPDGLLASSRKGSSNILVTAHGRAAHAGRDFYQGRNAIAALVRWLAQVELLSSREKGIYVTIGHIHGGETFNIVPDYAYAYINVRTDDAADAALTEECMQILADESSQQEGISLRLQKLSGRLPKPITPQTAELFSQFQHCAASLQMKLAWKPSGGVCDGNIVAECGLPTLDTLGVVGGNLHTDAEYAEISSISAKACLTGLFLLQLTEGEISPPKTGAFS